MAPPANVRELEGRVDEVWERLRHDKSSAAGAQRELFVSFSALWNDADAAGDTEALEALQHLRPKLRVHMPSTPISSRISMLLRIVLTVAVGIWGSLCVLMVGPVGLLLHPLLRACGVPNGYLPLDVATGLLFRVMLAAMGIKVRVDSGSVRDWGANPCGLITYNHASNLDPFVVNAVCRYLGPVYLSKLSVFKIPFFGWVCLLNGMVPIHRGDKEKAMHTMNDTVTEIMRRWRRCMAVAPEGTRSTDGHLILPFKKGVFHIQERTRAPLLPLAIRGAYELWPPGQLFCLPGELRVSVLPPQGPEASQAAGADAGEAYCREAARVQLQRTYAKHMAAHARCRAQPLSAAGWAEIVLLLSGAAVVFYLFYCLLAKLLAAAGLGWAGFALLMAGVTVMERRYVDRVL